MEAAMSVAVVSKDADRKVKAQVECSLCFAIGRNLANNVGPDDPIVDDTILNFCNTAGFFVEMCKDIALEHIVEFMKIGSPDHT